MLNFKLWQSHPSYKRLVYKTKSKLQEIRVSALFQSTSSENSGTNSTNAKVKGNKILETDLSAIELDRIRNFSIIAHIDHGKSTLADCMLEYVGAITKRTKQNDRILDKLQVERERGITVKAQTASVIYEVKKVDTTCYSLYGNLVVLLNA